MGSSFPSPLELPERGAGRMDSDHQAPGPKVRDRRTRFLADRARFGSRIIQQHARPVALGPSAGAFDDRRGTRDDARRDEFADLGAEESLIHGFRRRASLRGAVVPHANFTGPAIAGKREIAQDVSPDES